MAVRLDHDDSACGELPRACSRNDPFRLLTISGGNGGGATPVPIPNTAVKPSSADGTAWSPCGRVGRRRITLAEPGPFTTGQALAAFGALARRRPSARGDLARLELQTLAQRPQVARHREDAVAPPSHRPAARGNTCLSPL